MNVNPRGKLNYFFTWTFEINFIDNRFISILEKNRIYIIYNRYYIYLQKTSNERCDPE